VRIGDPARKHGVGDHDIQHAIENAIRQHVGEEFAMLIGPASDGPLLEIGVLDLESADPVVIHAMPARPKFLSVRKMSEDD
jgi:hypothetical protein